MMRKRIFLYFLSLFVVIQVLFYLSNDFEREKERQGFTACWSGSHVPGRQTWRFECNDPTLKESIQRTWHLLKSKFI